MDERVRKLLEQQREIDKKLPLPKLQKIKHECHEETPNSIIERLSSLESSIELLKNTTENQQRDSSVSIFTSNINSLSSTCKSLNSQIIDTNDELSNLREIVSVVSTSNDLFRETTTDKIDSNNRLLSKLKTLIDKNFEIPAEFQGQIGLAITSNTPISVFEDYKDKVAQVTL